MKILLDKGADVNAQGGRFYDNALEAASAGGHQEVVRTLLAKGADLNARGGYHGTALHAAVTGGNETDFLADEGGNETDPLADDGGEEEDDYYGKTAQILVENGAGVNTQSGKYGTVLQAASRYGRWKDVRSLLDNGAAVNTKAGKYGTALLAASRFGH